MVEATQGNGAEPRRPKKDRPRALHKTSKAAALAQLAERRDLAANVSAAARLWGVSRSTARTWMAEYAAMAVPPEPPPAAMAELLSAPPSPVAGAMVNPSHDEPFQAEPPCRDEEPRQEAPMAATMVDGPSPGDGASSAMTALADTPFPAMATSMVEKPAGVPIPVKP